MPYDHQQRSMETQRLHEQDWVIHVRKSFEEGFEEDDDDERVPVSIFSVPKTLLSIKQEAYTPQLVSIGPYHHKRLEVFEMERYKLASARRTQKLFKNVKFREIVFHFVEQYEGRIRASYHRSLEFDRETLGWMFAIDASFLLEFLETYAAKSVPCTSKSITRISSKMAHLIDYARRKTAHHAILRDIIMLENQIPLFLLRELHTFLYQHENNPDEVLAMMLVGICEDLSPIKMTDCTHFNKECFSKAHLLELLYYMVAPTLQSIVEVEENEIAKEHDKEENLSCCKKAFKCVTKILCSILLAPIYCCEKMVKSKLVIALITLPWTIIKSISRLKKKESVKELIDAAEEVELSSNEKRDDQSPLFEEIKIPSVSELSDIGVKFTATNSGLTSIKFKKSSGTFFLPIINIDDNSEVVLRNLVAYEASIAPEIMVFSRYTELMNGIIDTEEDVKILREAGVIMNRLKSDNEVATLWNGMTKSVRMTKVPILDKAIENANSYYSARWSVKINTTLKKYVFGSWPVLTFIAANIIIFLSAVQAVCSMYKCSKWAEKLD